TDGSHGICLTAVDCGGHVCQWETTLFVDLERDVPVSSYAGLAFDYKSTQRLHADLEAPGTVDCANSNDTPLYWSRKEAGDLPASESWTHVEIPFGDFKEWCHLTAFTVDDPVSGINFQPIGGDANKAGFTFCVDNLRFYEAP